MPATLEEETRIVTVRVAALGRALELPAEPPALEEIAFDFRYADFDDLWDTMLRLGGALARAINALPDDERQATRDDIAESVAPYRTDDGSYAAPASTWGVLAR